MEVEDEIEGEKMRRLKRRLSMSRRTRKMWCNRMRWRLRMR